MSAPSPALTIEQVSTVDDALVAALGLLVPQLSPASAPPDRARLQAVVTHAASTLLVARDGQGSIVGTLTLVVLPLPTAVRAWIEDVVVDAAARGQGVGEALTREALRLASARGAATIDLTTSPARTAANRLYQRLGFRRRETNPYRFDPSVGTRDV